MLDEHPQRTPLPKSVEVLSLFGNTALLSCRYSALDAGSHPTRLVNRFTLRLVAASLNSPPSCSRGCGLNSSGGDGSDAKRDGSVTCLGLGLSAAEVSGDRIHIHKPLLPMNLTRGKWLYQKGFGQPAFLLGLCIRYTQNLCQP